MRVPLPLAALSSAVASARAEFREVVQAIHGMDWATCAHAVSVALRRVDGIVSAEVRLNSGLADVRLAPGNRLDPEQLREVVRDHGFTPRGAEVVVRVRLEDDAGARILRVDGPDLAFHLDTIPAQGPPGGLLDLPQGSRVEVRAEWPEAESPGPDAPVCMLRVRSLRSLGPEE